MTVSQETEAEIRRLFFAEHWKRGTIVAQLGLHLDVVKRVTGSVGMKPGTVRMGPRTLEPYIPFIDETLGRYPKLRATRILDMIRSRGYAGSIGTLRRYVKKARPKPKAEAFLRIETLPGEQAQVDWAHVGELVVPGGKRPLWAFVMVLAYSRASFAELVPSLDVHSLRRSLVRAAESFGGLPRQWLFDNAKTIVIERHGDLARFHPVLLDVAALLHVQPRLCTPGRPQEKGGVERAIRFFKERFFAARSFHSIEHGNAQLRAFIAEIADARPHPRMPERTVAQVFEEEKARLLSLPNPLPDTDLVTPIAVDKTAFVRLDTNRYSVPPAFASQSLTLVASDTHVRLLDRDREVARHERCWGRNQWREAPEHRAELIEQKRAARDLKGRDRLRAEIPAIDVLYERWVEHERSLGAMVTRTLGLLDAYGPAVLQRAIAQMIERGTHDPGALAILCEQERHQTSAAPLVPHFADHVRERDVIPHDLGGYDG